MIIAAHLAAVLVASQLAMTALARAGWTHRATRTGIVTWQAVGLAWALAAVGIPLAIGLRAYGVGPLTALPAFVGDVVDGHLPGPVALALTGLGLSLGALLVATHVTSLAQAMRARARHRALLALVGRRDAAAPGALVLDHPAAAAYCLPGLRSTVVVSSGALALLERAELAAVLSHERAHADERHDLVLLPFTALCRFIELCGRRRARTARSWPRTAFDAVALLIEMRADDRALRRTDAGRLTAALSRFAATGTSAPAGALGITGCADGHLAARITRIRQAGAAPPTLAARVLPPLALSLAALLLAAPIWLLS